MFSSKGKGIEPHCKVAKKCIALQWDDHFCLTENDSSRREKIVSAHSLQDAESRIQCHSDRINVPNFL